jgi:CRISPR-associated endonuclease/helicase Cas3
MEKIISFSNVKKADIYNPIFQVEDVRMSDDIWAHSHTEKEPESLIEHSNLTVEYLLKNDETIIDNIIDKIGQSKEEKDYIKELFLNAVYLHDIGKLNPSFQKKIGNPAFENIFMSNSNHSDISGNLFKEYYNEKINEEYPKMSQGSIRKRLKYIVEAFTLPIKAHHTQLSNLSDYIQNAYGIKEFEKIDKEVGYYIYILTKILYSLLISSDFYATSKYFSNIEIEHRGFDKKKKESFNNSILQHRESFGKPEGINEIREDIYQTAQKNLLQNLDKNIFYLEAPTGSGKTLTSLGLVSTLLNNTNAKRVFYIFPFNTIVEQTYKTLKDEILKNNQDINVNIINSITAHSQINNDSEDEYLKVVLERFFYSSEVVLTSHIRFFEGLFGTKKDGNFLLQSLVDSIVVIDEIQAYNNKLWGNFIKFIYRYSELLNIKIIIMSATLPRLDIFLENDKSADFVELLKDKRDYLFFHPYFTNRVKIDFSLVDKSITLEEIKEKVGAEAKKGKKVLIEFIKKKSAQSFYELIKDDFANQDISVIKIDGDTNKAEREYNLNLVKNSNKTLVLVATQVIEAGADIDMDIGFKDISVLDSDEQFLGRINRNAKKEGLVYFFNLDGAGGIYKNDVRLFLTLKEKQVRELFLKKDFKTYYKLIIEKLKERGQSYDYNLKSKDENFNKKVLSLEYRTIYKEMNLIEDKKEQTFDTNLKIDIKKYPNIKEFQNIKLLKELNLLDEEGFLSGELVYNALYNIRSIKQFGEYFYKRFFLNAISSYFIK